MEITNGNLTVFKVDRKLLAEVLMAEIMLEQDFEKFEGTPQEFIEKSLEGLEKKYVVPTDEIKFLGATLITGYEIYGVDYLNKLFDDKVRAVNHIVGLFETLNLFVDKEGDTNEETSEIIC